MVYEYLIRTPQRVHSACLHLSLPPSTMSLDDDPSSVTSSSVPTAAHPAPPPPAPPPRAWFSGAARGRGGRGVSGGEGRGGDAFITDLQRHRHPATVTHLAHITSPTPRTLFTLTHFQRTQRHIHTPPLAASLPAQEDGRVKRECVWDSVRLPAQTIPR